jgi:hypothetical protein
LTGLPVALGRVDAATFVRGDFTAFAFLSMGTGAATTLGGKDAFFFLATIFSLRGRFATVGVGG